MIARNRVQVVALLVCLLGLLPAGTTQAPVSPEEVTTIEIHLLTEAGRKALPMGEHLSLRAGDRVTLLANAIDRTGASAIDWDPRWPEGKTGFRVNARGTWAELTALASGAYTLVLQAGASGPVTYLNLDIAGEAPAVVPDPIDTAGEAAAARLELHLIQETSTRAIAPGESFIGVVGNAYKFEARAFDAEGRRTSAFEPAWSPAPQGLDATIFEETAKVFPAVPGTFAMYVWDRTNPSATAALVLVAHEAPTVADEEPAPPTPVTYRSEVHRICSNLDTQYVRLLSAWRGRNDGEMQVSAQEIVRLGRQLDAQKPEGFLVLWHAPGMVQDARDLLDELRDTNRHGRPSYGDIGNEISSLRTNCMDCHRVHNASFIPDAVPGR